MLFEPVLKDYLWGGHRLQKFGRQSPDNTKIAESWEIASHKDGMSRVKNGPYRGKTLGEVFQLLGIDLVGRNNQWAVEQHTFPLLVKLLDASKRLSVQVHPDDEYAQEYETEALGKAEMWVVLEADPEAAIIYGLAGQVTPEILRQAVAEGTVETHLNRIAVKAGDHVCVPPGTLHAILEGVLIAEIQQNSNTTYRVYDWNRLGDDGQPRALHVEKALDVIDFSKREPVLPDATLIEQNAGWKRELLCRNKYFTTERFSFQPGEHYGGACDGSSLEIWGVLSGSAGIQGETIRAVNFCLLPAGLGKYSVEVSDGGTLIRVFTE